MSIMTEATVAKGPEKVHENLLRRMAQRQGFTLHRSRRRDPLALDYGTWTINGKGAPRGSLTLDEVEHFLTNPQERGPR